MTQFTTLDGKDSLVGRRATEIQRYGEFTFNSQSHYKVIGREPEGDTKPLLAEIKFQKGPIKEVGVNGIFIEDLLNICADQLEQFQASDFATRENACALTHIQEALMWLKKRTEDRDLRNVLGVYQV
jgi:hypothetical protein